MLSINSNDKINMNKTGLWQTDANKICDWRSQVLAAEAKNAGSTSERT